MSDALAGWIFGLLIVIMLAGHGCVPPISVKYHKDGVAHELTMP